MFHLEEKKKKIDLNIEKINLWHINQAKHYILNEHHTKQLWKKWIKWYYFYLIILNYKKSPIIKFTVHFKSNTFMCWKSKHPYYIYILQTSNNCQKSNNKSKFSLAIKSNWYKCIQLCTYKPYKVLKNVDTFKYWKKKQVENVNFLWIG